MVHSDADLRFMARAVRLAERGVGLTDPNPSVGCVIVRDGAVVGEGRTARVGGPHAEINALAAAGDLARGATAYVTLEPCAHQGRTGPCTEALIAAGIARVVAAGVDPDSRMAGQGFAALSAAGIETGQGLLEASARAVNPGYFSRLERGRPWVRLKYGASLDGRTALANGRSQWITGPDARADVHRWRARAGAVLTGVGTVLADDPTLTARPDDGRDFAEPIRVIVDSALRTPATARLFEAAGDVLIFCAGDAQAPADTMKGQVAALRDRGAVVNFVAAVERKDPRAGPTPERVSAGRDRVDLGAVLTLLAQRGVNTVWVEAGATLGGALLAAGLVDELILYLAPDLLGADARGMADIGRLTDLDDRIALQWRDVRRVGRDLRIVATPVTVRSR